MCSGAGHLRWVTTQRRRPPSWGEVAPPRAAEKGAGATGGWFLRGPPSTAIDERTGLRLAIFAILILCGLSYGPCAVAAQPVRGAGYEAALAADGAVADPIDRTGTQTLSARRRAAKIAYWSRVFGWNVARWYQPVHAYFPGHEREAFYVIRGESGGNPRARNAVCLGLFQLHRCHADNFRRVTGRPFYWSVYKPWPNIRYAAYMSRGGRDWSSWSVRP